MQADNCDLDKVIEFVVSFSNEHSLSQDILLKLSSIFDKDQMYREKYVISRACASLFSGKVREDALMEAGKTAFLLGFEELAAREFEEMLEENPENVEALCGYGTSSGQKGENWMLHGFSTKRLWNLILSMSIRFAITAACFTGSKEWTKPKKHISRALILDRENVSAHCGYGILLSKRGQKTEANYHYTRALELDPDHVESNFRYARFLEEKGEPLEAEKYYIVALKADPENPRPHLFYARLLADHGFIHGARVHFRYALKLNPEDVEAHCEYARLLARFGHRHEAEVQYKKALELDPGHFGTLRGYAALLKEKGQYAEAEEIYRQAEFFKRSAW